MTPTVAAKRQQLERDALALAREGNNAAGIYVLLDGLEYLDPQERRRIATEAVEQVKREAMGQ